MFKYYYNTKKAPFKSRVNCDIEIAEATLRDLTESGEGKMIDTATWNDKQRFNAYMDAIVIAVAKKSAVRKIYGTNRYPAVNFGKGVPSLVIFDKSDKPLDVYPRTIEERIVTINEYLRSSGMAL